MILVCNDFEFDNKKLSTKGYMSVNFDTDTSLPSVISREMETSNMNKYRPEKNGFGVTYNDVLEFEIHIMKMFNENPSQSELELSAQEFEDISSWLTSPQLYKWLTVTKEDGSIVKIKGYFSSIQAYENWGICYGLKCTFSCNSQYSYIDKQIKKSVNGLTNFIVSNESNELYDYVYPTFHITPSKQEEIYIHNLSDSKIVENNSFTVSDDDSENIRLLQEKVSNYATSNNLTVEYVLDEKTKDVKIICDNSLLFFYLIDIYGIKNKYFAYYLKSDKQYFICRNGLFYCSLNLGLKIDIDCKNLGVYDSLKRPVLFTDLGIQDEDELYWLRLIHGNNSFRIYGNFDLSIEYLEPHKGGLI